MLRPYYEGRHVLLGVRNPPIGGDGTGWAKLRILFNKSSDQSSDPGVGGVAAASECALRETFTSSLIPFDYWI